MKFLRIFNIYYQISQEDIVQTSMRILILFILVSSLIIIQIILLAFYYYGLAISLLSFVFNAEFMLRANDK